MADTTNFGWTKPTVGSDTGAWGGILNTLFDDQDTDVQAIKVNADAAMPKAGGIFTGVVEHLNSRYVHISLGVVTGTTDIDMLIGNVFSAQKSGSLTFTFSNPAASGNVTFFWLELENGAGTVWPASVKWPGGSAPALVNTTGSFDVLVFYTRDGGTTWRGALSMQDSS